MAEIGTHSIEYAIPATVFRGRAAYLWDLGLTGLGLWSSGTIVFENNADSGPSKEVRHTDEGSQRIGLHLVHDLRSMDLHRLLGGPQFTGSWLLPLIPASPDTLFRYAKYGVVSFVWRVN